MQRTRKQSAEPALAIEKLCKTYPSAAGEKTALQNITLDAHPGELVALLGPNGAGKTSLVECCVGLRSYDSGSIRLLGQDASKRNDALSARVGVMLQDGGLPQSSTAHTVLNHISAMYAHPRPVTELVSELGIQSFANTTVRRLSGGQRQRLALACALVGRPELLFLDEPTAGLDLQSSMAVWDMIDSLREQGVCIVLTTHLITDAEQAADYVYIIDNAAIVTHGTAAQLRSEDSPDATARVSFSTSENPPVETLARQAPPGTQIVKKRPGSYIATGRDAAELLVSITTWARDESVTLHELSTDNKSLEDVFLELTGRSLR